MTISDMQREYYATHALTVARHPSEKDERMMLRLLAFALFASDTLELTKGLSDTDQPDLWQKSATGDTELMIMLGQPEMKRLRKYCRESNQVVIVNYGGQTADLWWTKHGNTLQSESRFKNLTIFNVPLSNSQAIAALAKISMDLNITHQDNICWMDTGGESVQVEIEKRWPLN